MTDTFGNVASSEQAVRVENDIADWDSIQDVKSVMLEMIEILNVALSRGIAVEFSIQQRPVMIEGAGGAKIDSGTKEYYLAGFKADMTSSIVKPAVNG